ERVLSEWQGNRHFFSVCYSAFKDRTTLPLEADHRLPAEGMGRLCIRGQKSTKNPRRARSATHGPLSLAREELRCLFGVITHDKIGTRPPYRCKSFHHRSVVVKETFLASELEHRILARHVVCGDWHVEFTAHLAYDVKAGQCGLDHDDVRPFFH